MKKLFFILLTSLNLFSMSAYDMQSDNNIYDVSPLLFSADSVYVTEQEINCSEQNVEIVYTLVNKDERDLIIPVKIVCRPDWGNGALPECNLPYDFKVTSDDKEISFEVFNDNKKIDRKFWYEKNHILEGNKIVNFDISILKNSGKKICVSYRALNISGVIGEHFYQVRLVHNNKNKSINLKFSFCSKTDNDLFIKKACLCIITPESYSQKNTDILFHRYSDDKTRWTFEINNYNSYEENEYLDIRFNTFDPVSDNYLSLVFDKSEENTGIWMYSKNILQTRINKKDLFFLSKEQLNIIRNGIYAIHGYDFKKEALKNYFKQYNWYEFNPDFSESDFNDVEKYNINLIKEMENAAGPMLYSDCMK